MMKSKSTTKGFANPILLTPAQLKSRQEQLLIVDVRGRLEYLMGHIPGAHCFSRDRILQNVAKDHPIALTCLSGHRSAMVAQWLVAQGYRQVHNLQGGLLAWQSTGYSIQRGLNP
ncbi:rhodanese [Leptolyngbya sp. 'hensonii']|uniref:rhodanese-like domain-containing protein n=1 Tax=Leptolyngbya sp. 'hensonii' TaxID=1922337 RepID=UPI00095004F6|nr:rhodanese-like domain-containing protein [Leptolyngbya sp. 'hensonii']OLP17513.1 rhodanese [Leptolyngbya sp. 'hensonii']